MPDTNAGQPRRSGLFARIYLFFVVTVLLATAVAAVGGWVVARNLSSEWVGDTIEVLGNHNDALVDDLDDPVALDRYVHVLEGRLGTRLGVYTRQGERLVGEGPPRIPRRLRRFGRKIERGQPIVHRLDERRGTMVLYPLTDPASGTTRAIVMVLAAPRPRVLLAGLGGLFVLGVLGLGAYALSRSMTRRLARLERSAGRIATGELGHRVALPRVVRDEIDQLGVAFNEMAAKVETLLLGQRTLLANVSHELRTPISRIKVLLEILEERLDRSAAGGAHGPDLERVRRGLQEMAVDVAEIETLIGDLLTSGRLELKAGEGVLDRERVSLNELLRPLAERFDARLEGFDEEHVLMGDTLLLGRLFSNLLANARRACPQGVITITANSRGDDLVVEVEDEGPGIAPEDRERVFEPFTRLDQARTRDQGGVGLGLHLCRQIARAHGGSIVADGRRDGRPGARLRVTLPLDD